jgi:protein gp37
MSLASNHCFQILTKRSKRLKEISEKLSWSKNIWMGVSAETSAYLSRIDDLKKTGAFIKFLSLEPLLGQLDDLDLTQIDWVIVGGESGPGARPMKKEWVTNIKGQCDEANVPFFFKQWGGVNKKKNGRVLEGKTWNEMPDLRKTMNRNQLSFLIEEY